MTRKRCSTLPERVLACIRERGLMKPGDRVGVAVSGGADSVALLRILLELRGELGVVLSVVHVNHQLRGEESDADEAFVAELAERYGLQLFLHQVAVRAHAADNNLSLEAAGREQRYKFFYELAGRDELNRIATAHTLDDQAETVLLKALRGAWTRGLAGIYPVQSLATNNGMKVVRPLLGERRFALRDHLGFLHQSWREDATNDDRSFARNRIRHELLPLLERDFNPAVTGALGNLAELARTEEEYWDEEIPELWASIAGFSLEPGADRAHEFQINLPRLKKLSIAEQRRLVIYALRDLAEVAVDFEHVEAARLAILRSGATALLGGYDLSARAGRVTVKRRKGAVERPSDDSARKVNKKPETLGRSKRLI